MSARKQRRFQTNWPTPDEIAARAAAIRSSWSPHQLRIRAGLSPEENSVEISVVAPGTLDGRRNSPDLG